MLRARLGSSLPVYFDYFFFDENCSYHLLGLLQVARPGPGADRAVPAVGAAGRHRARADRAARAGAQDRLPPVERHAHRRASRARCGRTSAAWRGTWGSERWRRLIPRCAPARRARRGGRRGGIRLSELSAHHRREQSAGRRRARARAALARNAIDAPSQAPHVQPGTRPDEGHRTSRVARRCRAARRRGVRRARPAADLPRPARRRCRLRRRRADRVLPPAGAPLRRPRRPHRELHTVGRLVPAAARRFLPAASWRLAAGWQRTLRKAAPSRSPPGADGGIGGAWA